MSSGRHEIWVGNVPYDATEEELRAHIATVVEPLSVRIRYDRETGQSKGFAFCDLDSIKACASAIKYLQGTTLRGRPLRFDFCSAEQAKYYNEFFNQGTSDAPSPSRTLDQLLLQQPRRREGLNDLLTSNVVQTEGENKSSSSAAASLRFQISKITSSLSAAQLFYLLGHLQQLVLHHPQEARHLLRSNSSLCYAVLHALVICGLVDVPFKEVDDVKTLIQMEDMEALYSQMQQAHLLYLKAEQKKTAPEPQAEP